MDFARQQLEKYGWKEGDGLGKSNSGISKPIKAKLKFDNAGLGHNLADEIINPWWQRVYDSAAEGVKVCQDNGEVIIEAGETDVTTKKKKRKRTKEKNEKYNNFLKRAALTKEGEKSFGSDNESEEESVIKKKTSGICDLTDEELFKACGGRTAHKGARHGLAMTAKLQRSMQLENEAILKLQGLSGSDVPSSAVDPSYKKKKKKKKKDH